MKKIFSVFRNEVIRLTFRLLPSKGSMPWALSVPKENQHTNPLADKVHSVKKPWLVDKPKKEEIDSIVQDIATGSLAFKGKGSTLLLMDETVYQPTTKSALVASDVLSEVLPEMDVEDAEIMVDSLSKVLKEKEEEIKFNPLDKKLLEKWQKAVKEKYTSAEHKPFIGIDLDDLDKLDELKVKK